MAHKATTIQFPRVHGSVARKDNEENERTMADVITASEAGRVQEFKRQKKNEKQTRIVWPMQQNTTHNHLKRIRVLHIMYVLYYQNIFKAGYFSF